MTNDVATGEIYKGAEVWACVNGEWVRATVHRVESAEAILVSAPNGAAPQVLPSSHVKSMGVARGEWKQVVFARAKANATHTMADLAARMRCGASWVDARDAVLSLLNEGRVTASPFPPATPDAPVTLGVP